MFGTETTKKSWGLTLLYFKKTSEFESMGYPLPKKKNISLRPWFLANPHSSKAVCQNPLETPFLFTWK